MRTIDILSVIAVIAPLASVAFADQDCPSMHITSQEAGYQVCRKNSGTELHRIRGSDSLGSAYVTYVEHKGENSSTFLTNTLDLNRIEIKGRPAGSTMIFREDDKKKGAVNLPGIYLCRKNSSGDLVCNDNNKYVKSR